jgi:hypothetical protein
LEHCVVLVLYQIGKLLVLWYGYRGISIVEILAV